MEDSTPKDEAPEKPEKATAKVQSMTPDEVKSGDKTATDSAVSLDDEKTKEAPKPPGTRNES